MNTELNLSQVRENFRAGKPAEEATQAAEKMLIDIAYPPTAKEQWTSPREPGATPPDGKLPMNSPIEPGGRISDLPEAKCGVQDKCVTVTVDETKNKFDRFATPGEMDMRFMKTPFVRFLSGGEVLSQKGDQQVLNLTDGTSIEVSGSGTFAVRDQNGNRLLGEEMLIKPMPGYTPRGTFLSFGDRITANIFDGTIHFRTNSGASIDVDNRGFATISREESLRFLGEKKR